MPISQKLTFLSLVFLLFSILFVLSSFQKITKSITYSTVPHSSLAMCIENEGLPDSRCTPGSIDPAVNQNNIHSTICTQGYTKTVRPHPAYTQSLKIQQIQEYGYIDKNIHDYEEDHLIPLELGGNPTDPKNLWPEPGASPNDKDNIESMCNQKVCGGDISLSEGQKEIAANWETACR